ncbi:MAG: Ku protein [Phycisphaerales bacterium]|jgi:DNA end-binding protein Ku
MRPIWKGHISFGLVSVPVTLYPAEERTDLQLHMVDSRNHARVKYERVNAETGEEVPWDQIVKGYEYHEGSYVLIGEADLKKAAPEATRTVDIEAFVNQADIDPMYFDKPYFLEPSKGGEKGYALLRETLRETKKVGIAKVVIRTRQYLAAMSPRRQVLMLDLLRYKGEIRSEKDLSLPGTLAEVGVSKAELKMAHMLVGSMSQKWDPDQYSDRYRDALMKWIQQKVKAGEIEQAPHFDVDDDAPAPINLMEALKKSIAHGGQAEAAPARTAKPKAARSRSARPARKASRRKAG